MAADMSSSSYSDHISVFRWSSRQIMAEGSESQTQLSSSLPRLVSFGQVFFHPTLATYIHGQYLSPVKYTLWPRARQTRLAVGAGSASQSGTNSVPKYHLWGIPTRGAGTSLAPRLVLAVNLNRLISSPAAPASLRCCGNLQNPHPTDRLVGLKPQSV